MVKTSLPPQGVQVRSLVREQRSHMLHGPPKYIEQKQYCNKFNKDFKRMVHINKKSGLVMLENSVLQH